MERAPFFCLPPLAEPLHTNIWKALILTMSVHGKESKKNEEWWENKTVRQNINIWEKRKVPREVNKGEERQNIKDSGNILQTLSAVINMVISQLAQKHTTVAAVRGSTWPWWLIDRHTVHTQGCEDMQTLQYGSVAFPHQNMWWGNVFGNLDVSKCKTSCSMGTNWSTSAQGFFAYTEHNLVTDIIVPRSNYILWNSLGSCSTASLFRHATV